MDFVNYISLLYDYNYWANQRYVDVAWGLSDEDLRRPLGHSWGSVNAVLLHMMSAEWVWLRRWSGESPHSFPSEAECPNLDALAERWTAQEAEVRAFIAAQNDETVQRELAYTNTKGMNFHLPLWQMILHVPNHNTHHRGELAAMFAVLQAPHPEEDMHLYWLEKSGQR